METPYKTKMDIVDASIPMESRDLQCHKQRLLVVNKIKELVEALDSSYCEELRENKCHTQEHNAQNEREKYLQGNACDEVAPEFKNYAPPKPSKAVDFHKQTLDGRDVYERPKYVPPPDDTPTRPPPWMRPRYASVELRGGIHNNGCECVRRNGLQDDCPRWDCSGRPECDSHPWPTCIPEQTAPFIGVRRPNLIPAYPTQDPICSKSDAPSNRGDCEMNCCCCHNK